MNVIELIDATGHVLRKIDVPYAIGGAIALGYHAEPRSTIDLDLNVFVRISRAAQVVDAFEPLGLRPERPAEQWMPAAGVRLAQSDDRAVVDLFFSLDDTYDAILGRCIEQPFGPDGAMVPVLSAEDLVVFKLSFGRPKDWVDLDALVRTGSVLDVDGIERTLIALRGPTIYPRIARFRSMIA